MYCYAGDEGSGGRTRFDEADLCEHAPDLVRFYLYSSPVFFFFVDSFLIEKGGVVYLSPRHPTFAAAPAPKRPCLVLGNTG